MKEDKKVKILNAWILEFGGFFKPMITWEKPTKKEMKTAADYGSKYYKCTITYSPH